MRILWFTNTPSLAEEKLNNKPAGGGWIKSLEKEINKNENIELGIAFYHSSKMAAFDYLGTRYYPIYKQTSSYLNRLYNRALANLENSSDLEVFEKIIKEFDPDIIHIFGSEGPFGLIQERINNRPIVLSIQGNITVYYYKYFSGITKSSVKKYSTIRDKILFKTYNNISKIFLKRAKREQKIFGLTDNIIGRTDWDRRISSILAPRRKYYHNDEILRESFYSKEWNQHFKLPFKIFTTTSKNLYKGIEVILYAANLLDKLKIKYQWNIAGLRTNDKIIKIASKSINQSISENLVFVGQKSENELIESLLSAHIYVAPSHIENSPNSLCEALILGLPCIASNVGGTSTLIENNVDGILIQNGDPWVLAGSIKEFFDDFEKARSIGRNARKNSLMRHNPKKITFDLLNIYQKILNDFKIN